MGKGSNTTTTQQAQTYNPAGSGYIQNALQQGQSAAQTPFAQPVAPVAGFSQDQLSAFHNVNNAQGMAQPYINQAANYFSPQGAQSFLNPYAANVMAGLQDVFGQQQSQATGQLTQAAGGVGADRIAVGQSELAKQQGLAAGQTLSGLYNNAVQQAQSAGYGTAGLGSQAQNAALQGAQAQLGTGGLQQQLSQAQLNAPYQNTLARLAYPFQTAQFNAGITGALAPGLGGTTTGQGTTTGPTPSMLSQILGLGTAGVGAAGAAGAFNGNKGASYGGGSPLTGDAYGGSAANPLPGLVGGTGPNSDYGFAQGGVPDTPIEDSPSIVPNEPLTPIRPNIPQLNLNPPAASGQQGGGAGDALKMGADVAKIAMMFAKRGGAIRYVRGGDVNPDEKITAYPDFDTATRTELDSFIPPELRPRPMPYEPSRKVEPGYAEGGTPDFNDRFPAMTSVGPVTAIPPSSPLDAEKYPAGSDFNPIRMPSAEEVQAEREGNPRQTVPVMAADDSASPAGAAPPAIPSATSNDVNNASQASTEAPDGTSDFAKSPWMALMAAGLGIAGGTSPFPLVNIGRGGLQGVKTLEEQRAASQKDETIAQAAKRLAQEAKFHEDQYTKMTPYQKASNELAVEKQKMEGLKPVQVGQDDYGRPIMAKRNPQTGDYEIIKHTPPTNVPPVDPNAPAASAPGVSTPPPTATGTTVVSDTTMPPNATPTEGQGFNLSTGTFASDAAGKTPPPADVNPDALTGMKPSDANKVRAIAEGRQRFLPLTRNNAYNRYIMDKVNEYDPAADEGAFSRRSRVQNFFAVGTQGGGGQNIAAMNTFGQHADELFRLSQELNLGQFTTWNEVKNYLAEHGYGKKEIQDKLGAYEVARKAVGDEGAKVFAGTNSALADRAAWEEKFSPANPASVTKAKLQEVTKLIQGRLNSLTEQYNDGMRTNHAPQDFIKPRTREVFDRINGINIRPDGSAAPAAAAPAARPDAATRFGQLTASGLSKADAYTKLHQEGY
jgi:hypothetical protein